MLKVYPGIIYEDEGTFWIEFPDLPGCQSTGDNIDELMTNAEEALGVYLATKMDYVVDWKAPSPSRLEELDAGEGVKTYVSTDVSKYHRETRAVQKMISLPEWMAKEVDKNNISLSKFLQEALAEKLSLA